MESYRPPQSGQPLVNKVLSRAHLTCLIWVCGARPKAETLDVLTTPGIRKTNTKRPSLKLGTWNVRTMLTGISDDLQSIDDLRKTAVINDELARLNINIAALQETRLAEAACLREKDYTFYWQGKSNL